ncbi:MAG: HAMP domain-containing protein [Acidimicrobiia bacterium]|nr:HAMP domain-containing protein [Acidimicrobiia bacterium]
MIRVSIRVKQIAGVTALVGLVVVLLSVLHATRLARLGLHESEARGRLLASAIFHRVSQLVAVSPDPDAAIRNDPGLLALLQSSIYGESITDAAIVDRAGVIVAHSDPSRVGLWLDPRPDMVALLDASAWQQLRVIYGGTSSVHDVRQAMTLDDDEFGSIRIGVSTLLLREELNAALGPAFVTAAIALGASVLLAGVLAQLLLRPIHVIRSGLTRLGRGEFGVTLDLPPGDEFGDLGTSFNSVSQQLSADRSALADQKASLESAVDSLEDAVALFTPDGGLLFANPGMRAVLPPDPVGQPIASLFPAGHPFRQLVEETLETRRSLGPQPVTLGADDLGAARTAGDEDEGSRDERLLVTHAIPGGDGVLVGVLLVARNLSYLSQVQSTLAYSRKLAALGRLTAGVAHQVKNPLNAMMIHLELLRAKADTPEAREHVDVIAGEIRRLDEVVQGFLKFTRPEELRLEAVPLAPLLAEMRPVLEADAERLGVAIVVDCPSTVPHVRADRGMVYQALVNLAVNACQAMPSGGTLRITAVAAPGRRVEVRVADTGVGIPPEHLSRIFDLYFTTKDHGSGIGLSLVYRIIQLHDGEIDVESTPGRGTTFRVRLPRAEEGQA